MNTETNAVDTSSETVESTGGDAVETVDTSTAAPVEENQSQATPQGDAGVVAYTPKDFKVRVMDQEYEIDEFLRTAIKEEKHEKRLRELYEKAYGLDYVKPKHEALQQKHQQVELGIKTLSEYLGGKKYKEFFDFWNIPKEDLFNHVAEMLRFEELPPEQKAAIMQQQEVAQKASQAELRAQQLEQQYTELSVKTRIRELDQMLSRPDIMEIAKQYDVGRKPGQTFRDLVVRVARQESADTGRDMSVDEAVRTAMSILGYAEVDEAATSQPSPMMAAPVAQKKLPVLPNVGSGGASPVRKQVTSLKDLKALRDKAAD